jgi:hypothetical protein
MSGDAKMQRVQQGYQPTKNEVTKGYRPTQQKMALPVKMQGISIRYGNRMLPYSVFIGPMLRRKRRAGGSLKSHQAANN